jgi:hypothetical protein
MRKHPYLVTLIFILLLGVILRFTNASDRYSFDGDAVRDAIVAYEGARNFYFPLAGPFSSTGPYTFGPWYFTGIIFFSIIFPTPYSPWILMGILSLFTILLMADIGRLLYSKTFGIILAVLTAIAPTQINMATGLSNINPVALFATLSIWIVLKLITKEFSHFLWYVALGIALGMGINMHFQMLGLLVLPVLLWIRMGWKKYHIPLLIFLGIFITFIPLLIFNFLTNWHTVNGINEMLIAKERTYVPNSWKIYLFEFWISHLKFLLFSPTFVNILLVLTFLGLFIKELVKKKYSSGLSLLVIVFSVNFLWLRYYWGERHDVYLLYLSPLLFIFFGYTFFSLLKMKYGKILFVFFSLIIGWYMLLDDYTKIVNASADVPKQQVQLLHNKYPDQNIILYSCSQFYEPDKRAVLYLLSFYHEPQTQEKKLGMLEPDCEPPTIVIKNKTAEEVYPPLVPALKEEHFNFIDLSQTTPEALKQASWEPISTKDIFNSTVNWWKK